MAIAANAILGRAGVHPEESVVILGTGPIALLALQMVRSAGAAFVATTGLDADEEVRFSIARDLGADACLNAERTDAAAAVRKMMSGRGVDLVVDLSGAPPAIVSGFRMLKKNGRFCAIGLPGSEVVLPWSELVLNACTVHFSYSSDYIAWERCLSMLSERRVRTEGFTDNVFPLESWSEAFDSAASGRVLKAIVNPHPK